MEKTLFCIHFPGSDDIVPVHDMAEAVRGAAFLNAEYLSAYAGMPDDGLTPYGFACPAVWPGSREAHAEALQSAKDDNTEKKPHWMCA